ncbi:phosphoribosylamine--glycine ligase [uncultured Tyzzerella sp.]|uniref:phosphoribosylamine--glycine ligase n=1 Tax=uncultured Tyzzerella sp. TaxID=2321398 RepID=UPI002942B819|nr:phosphoribosylamine--glycine ligase [uncultured Tyzzerella sp.]
MKILVVGGGGREHAIVHKLSKSKKVDKIYCAPGNPGIKELAETVNISPMDFDLLIKFVKDNNIDMTIAAMDDTLVAGIVDEFEKNNLKIFGPNKRASIIEGSKAFSKDLMKKYNIPTASYENFSSYEDAIKYVESLSFPIVIKADGLALGKGVLICKSLDEAKESLKEIMLNKKFGKSGENVVIEEFMVGKEVSILCFCDGKTIVPMVSAQDHKRAFDNDEGPNTGGMGTISPSKYYTEDIAKTAMETIFVPTMEALAKEDREFVGVLFFGLMLTEQGPKVIEYNARFGDPETQVVLPRLKTDLIDIINACLDKKLESINIEWEDYATSCVILASGGYPDAYEKGYEITGLEECKNLQDVFIYHAGTSFKDNKIVNNGGRVLGVMAKGENLEKALEKSYNALNIVHFKDSFYRKDIGKR